MEEAASSLGLEVDAVSDPARFRAAAKDHPPDLQIVDHALPNVREAVGLGDGPELVAVTAAESKHVPTVFLTSYKPDCLRRLSSFDPRLVATAVDKPTNPSADSWLSTLREAVDDIQAQPAFEDPEPIGVELDEMESDFFRMSPDDLDGLPEEKRDDVEVKATSEVHSQMSSAWNACDADWLMLQKVDDTVLVTDRGVDADLPTDEVVHGREQERESTALLIGRPTMVEEMSSGPIDCSPDRHKNWRRYPIVRLIVGETERAFHMDTGSPESYISREFLADCVTLPKRRPKRTIVSDAAGNEEALSQLPVEVDLHVLGPSGNAEVSMLLQAVKNWRSVRLLNPACRTARCPDSEQGQCGHRLGLMGRDMLYGFGEGVWQFDPRSGQFYAVSR
ncbi:MAG TPA: response regulator [Solirubrobacterales bacterium]|nr:response regulator [Solirubrobacterales bacterium]